MSIVHSTVESMKGEIRVSSELNRGTTFRIQWPLSGVTEVFVPILDTTPAFKKLNGRVLVVDDEDGVRIILKRYLSQMGLEVDEACEGEAALEKIKSRDYFGVITDLKMPRMNGIELIRTLSVLKPNLRVIVVSGIDVGAYPPEDMRIVLDRAHAVIPKPIKKDNLYCALR